MCGLVYVKSKVGENVNQAVKVLYHGQKERGRRGFGLVGLNNRLVNCYFRGTTEEESDEVLNNNSFDEIIFHHRQPTSTANTKESCHPFKIDFDNKTYYFVHNGIIFNDSELRTKHQKRGIKYVSERKDDKEIVFNDSEALAHEFVLWLNRREKNCEAMGSAAFICLETDSKSRQALNLYFYRNNYSELKIFNDKEMFVLISEGDYIGVKGEKLLFYNYQTGKIKSIARSFGVNGGGCYYGYGGGYSGKDYYGKDYYKENYGGWDWDFVGKDELPLQPDEIDEEKYYQLIERIYETEKGLDDIKKNKKRLLIAGAEKNGRKLEELDRDELALENEAWGLRDERRKLNDKYNFGF
jgi:predicted glutamine amidotransferase